MIDGHAHLEELKDIDAAISNAKAAGVGKIIAVGMDIESNRAALDFASRFPSIVYPAVGYHPWSITAETAAPTIEFVRENLPSCVALGEVGLDYKTKVKKNLQWEVFDRLLSLAKEAGKPVITHCRYSYERALDMATRTGIEKAVFHWFVGEKEILSKILDAGYFISVTPALAYSPLHREAAGFAPIDRILAETDAPVEYQGHLSEPADVLITIRELAAIKGISEEEAERQTDENTKSFYGFS